MASYALTKTKNESLHETQRQDKKAKEIKKKETTNKLFITLH